MRVLAVWLGLFSLLLAGCAHALPGKRIAGGAQSAYPVAVVLAGAQAAWDAAKNCGPAAGTTFTPASSLTGTGVSKGAPNIDVNTASANNFNAYDFIGWITWFYGNGSTTITNSKFLCNLAVTGSCTSGYQFIAQGKDSSETPRTGATLDIENSSIDGTNRWNAQQLIQPTGTSPSTLTIGFTCLINAPEDYIGTGATATLVLKNDFFAAQGKTAVAGANGDHTEMVHMYGTSATITDTMFNQTAFGPTVPGVTNVLLFLDASITATGSIAGTTVTFTTNPGTLVVGAGIYGTGVSANTAITGGISQWNGTSATATVNISQTVTTTTLTIGSSPRQTVTISRSIFIHDGTGLFDIQVGGILTIDHSVLKIGTAGHYINLTGAISCTDGGGNYDLVSGLLINPCS